MSLTELFADDAKIFRSMSVNDNTILQNGVDKLSEWPERLQNKEDLMAIERVPRRATKLFPRLEHFAYEERLHEMPLPTLLHRRQRGDMIFVYKIVIGRLNEY